MPEGQGHLSDVNRGNGRLSSWKEIADYLGVDKRTCFRWEVTVHKSQ